MNSRVTVLGKTVSNPNHCKNSTQIQGWLEWNTVISPKAKSCSWILLIFRPPKDLFDSTVGFFPTNYTEEGFSKGLNLIAL